MTIALRTWSVCPGGADSSRARVALLAAADLVLAVAAGVGVIVSAMLWRVYMGRHPGHPLGDRR